MCRIEIYKRERQSLT